MATVSSNGLSAADAIAASKLVIAESVATRSHHRAIIAERDDMRDDYKNVIARARAHLEQANRNLRPRRR